MDIHLRKRVSSYCLLEEAFINERLRQNCESFTSKKLSDITSKIGSGATPRGGEESYKSEGISLIRSLNVYDDGFREKKLAFIDEVQAKALANVEIKTGDVLLNITGASIARTCIAPKEYLPARVNQHVSIIRPKPEIISTEYLHFLLRSQRMKSSLLGVGNSGGSTRQALTKVDLENTIIEFPPDLENQKEAVDELKSFGDLSKTFMNNLNKLKSLYSDLQNSLLISELSGSII
jgi:type I restriction enzyme S subunit